MEHEQSIDKEISEEEDEMIVIDDMSFLVTFPSPPLPSDGKDQQCYEETSSMLVEIGMYDFDSLASNEFIPSTPLPVSS